MSAPAILITLASGNIISSFLSEPDESAR